MTQLPEFRNLEVLEVFGFYDGIISAEVTDINGNCYLAVLADGCDVFEDKVWWYSLYSQWEFKQSKLTNRLEEELIGDPVGFAYEDQLLPQLKQKREFEDG
jgi:hypothetical protein